VSAEMASATDGGAGASRVGADATSIEPGLAAEASKEDGAGAGNTGGGVVADADPVKEGDSVDAAGAAPSTKSVATHAPNDDDEEEWEDVEGDDDDADDDDGDDGDDGNDDEDDDEDSQAVGGDAADAVAVAAQATRIRQLVARDFISQGLAAMASGDRSTAFVRRAGTEGVVFGSVHDLCRSARASLRESQVKRRREDPPPVRVWQALHARRSLQSSQRSDVLLHQAVALAFSPFVFSVIALPTPSCTPQYTCWHAPPRGSCSAHHQKLASIQTSIGHASTCTHICSSVNKLSWTRARHNLHLLLVFCRPRLLIKHRSVKMQKSNAKMQKNNAKRRKPQLILFLHTSSSC
jgi:hypothetical protein